MIAQESTIAPGSVVEVRDEEWLVTSAEQVDGVWRVEVQGLTELVRNTGAVFFGDIDRIVVRDPRLARLVGDDSPRYRRSRLWLEATLRKTPVPHGDPRLAVSQRMLVDPLILPTAGGRPCAGADEPASTLVDRRRGRSRQDA